MHLWITIFLMFVLKCSAQDVEYAEMAGEVTVAGLFEIQSSTASDECDPDSFIATSVQMVEAIKWVFQGLNAANYIPGVRIGFLAGKTCKRPHSSNRYAFDLTKRMANERQETGTSTVSPILGLIGPENSQETEVVSRILSALPAEDRLLQIGFSTTSDSLDDRVSYSNFYRVVPPDAVQVQTIIALLKKLEWNRLALVHDDTVYGSDLAQKFLSAAKTDGICIPYTATISATPPYNQRTLQEIVNNLMQSRNQFMGIIFLGNVDSASAILNHFQVVYNLIDMPMFVFSEGIELKVDAFTSVTGEIFKLAKGSLALSPPQSQINEFYHHWKGLFRNTTELVKESESNPWLLDIFEQYSSCRPSESNPNACASMTDSEIAEAFPQGVFAQYAIMSAYVMAKSIKQSVISECGNAANGLCSTYLSKLRRISLIENMKQLDVNLAYQEDFPSSPAALQELGRLQFDTNGNVKMVAGRVQYQIHNFKDCGERFCFQQVGDFLDGTIDLDVSNIESYTLNGVPASGSLSGYATCQAESVCDDCLRTDVSDSLLYIPGDVILVALLPVYNKGQSIVECGDDIRPYFSVDFVEGVRFAVEQINDNPDVFTHKKVGLIVINTCVSPLVTQEKILSLHKNGVPLRDGTFDRTVINRILGYVGPWHSSTAIPASNVLKNIGYFSVSTGATSTLLSDRDVHPYFMRTTTPDNMQGEAVVEILKRLDVGYIQVIYSKESYGKGGMTQVVAAAKDHEICVANTYGIEVDNSNVNLILNELRKNGHARVVVVWSLTRVATPAIQTVAAEMGEGEFVFVGSESWETEKQIIEGRPKTIGAITMSLEMPLDPDFKTYFRLKTIDDFDINPWLQPYIEARFNCYYSWSFNKKGSQKCAQMDVLFGETYEHTDWTSFAINTTLAALKGTDKAIQAICGSTVELAQCEDYRNKPAEVVKHIMQVEAYVDGRMIRVFDGKGDGTVGYRIYNVQRDSVNPQDLVYVKLGRWMGGGGEHGTLEFDESRLVTFNDEDIVSVCPNDKVCDACFGPPTTEATTVSTVPLYIILGALLGGITLAFITTVIVFCCCWWRRQAQVVRQTRSGQAPENTYITPSNNQHVSTISYDTCMDQFDLDDETPELPRKPSSRQRSQMQDTGSNEYTNLGVQDLY